MDITKVSDEQLQEWLEDYQKSGLFRDPRCPFNYYEVQAEVNRRKYQKEA